MKRSFSSSCDKRWLSPKGVYPDAFSVVELVVVVAIVGVIAALSIPSFVSLLRRERANAVSLSLYGWLNQVRQASTRVEGEGCRVSFNSASFDVGETLAEVTNARCASLLPNDSYINDGSASQDRSIQMSASSASIVYTPRTLSSNAADLILSVSVDNSPPVRCLKILAVSGAIVIGRNDASANLATSCSYGSDKTL